MSPQETPGAESPGAKSFVPGKAPSSLTDLQDHPQLAGLPRDSQGWPVLGPVTILNLIGTGSMGPVFYGLHSQIGCEVAVKLLEPDLARNLADQVDRFLGELGKASRIVHDHLVRVLDARKEGALSYVVTEYVRGESAADHLQRLRKKGAPGLSPRDAFKVVGAATRGLAAMHQAGMVHRDFRPENILIPRMDLGLAKLGDLGFPTTSVVSKGRGGAPLAAIGTPGYMAPEQAADPNAAAPTMDVFSAGATLYTLLTGEPPFRGADREAILRDTAEKEPEPLPSWIRPGPRALIQKCLEKDPSKRFANANDLLMALDVLQAAAETQLPPPPSAVEEGAQEEEPAADEGTVPAGIAPAEIPPAHQTFPDNPGDAPSTPPEEPMPEEAPPTPAGPAPGSPAPAEEIQSALDMLAASILDDKAAAPPSGEAAPSEAPPPDNAAIPFVVVPRWPEPEAAPPAAPPPEPEVLKEPEAVPQPEPPPPPIPEAEEPPPPPPPPTMPEPLPPPPAPPPPMMPENLPLPPLPMPPEAEVPVPAAPETAEAAPEPWRRPRSAKRRVFAGALVVVAVAAVAASYYYLNSQGFQFPWKRGTAAAPPAHVPSPPPGTDPSDKGGPGVILSIQPDPQELLVDGKKVSPGLKSLPLAEGPHRLEAIFPGGARVEQPFEVSGANRATLDIRGYDAIARKHEEAQRWAEAETWYGRALARARSDAERRTCEEALARVRPLALEERKIITILSQPPGAAVFLGDRKLGETPFGLERLEAGDHVLVFKLEGHLDESLSVKVEPGKKAKWEARLKARTGEVRLTGLRAGDVAKLLDAGGRTVRDAIAQESQIEFRDLPEGDYEAVVERKGCAPGKWRIQAQYGKPAKVSILMLKAKPGSLRVASEPPGAEIHLDGKKVGQTPARLADLPAGAHAVRLVHPERSDWEGTAEVKSDEQAELSVSLPPTADLRVETHPEGASVTGAVRGKTPLAAKVKAGRRSIRLSDPAAGEVERGWEAEAGKAHLIRVDLWEERARDLERAGQYLEASKAWRNSILEGHDARAEELEKRARYEAAMKAAAEAMESGDMSQAEASILEALAVRPGDPAATELLRRLPEERERRYREAMERAARAVEKEDWRAALAAFSDALRCKPDDERARAGLIEARKKRVYDKSLFEEIRVIQAHKDWIHSVAYSPDGRRLASGSNDRTAKIWSLMSGREIRSLAGHGQWVISVAFSPNGENLATASNDRTIRIWETATGKEVRSMTGHLQWTSVVVFSPDGKTIASAGGDTTIKYWDAALGRELRSITGHTQPIWALAFSADGNTLASGSADRSVKLWDAAGGWELRTLEGHEGPVMSVAFSPDGKTVASGSQDTTVRLWQVANGKEIRSLSGHRHSVSTVAFSPDGKVVASAGADQTIRLWSAESGKEIKSLIGHTGPVFSVAFSPDGKGLVSAGEDATLRVWGVPD